MFTIARPPTLTQQGFGQFDMAHLAIWLYYLTDNQASQTGGLVLSNSKLDGSLLTCIRKNCKYFCINHHNVFMKISHCLSKTREL